MSACSFSTVQRQTEVVQELEYEISLLSSTKQILTEELKKLQRCDALLIERLRFEAVWTYRRAAAAHRIASRNVLCALGALAVTVAKSRLENEQNQLLRLGPHTFSFSPPQ